MFCSFQTSTNSLPSIPLSHLSLCLRDMRLQRIERLSDSLPIYCTRLFTISGYCSSLYSLIYSSTRCPLPSSCTYKFIIVIWLWSLYLCYTVDILTCHSTGVTTHIKSGSVPFKGPSAPCQWACMHDAMALKLTKLNGMQWSMVNALKDTYALCAKMCQMSAVKKTYWFTITVMCCPKNQFNRNCIN